jgi:hypothetical protein
MLRAMLLTAAMLLVSTARPAQAAVVFSNNDWGGPNPATGTALDLGTVGNISQIGSGLYYSPVSIPGWSVAGQVLGWSTGTKTAIDGILLNEGPPAQGAISISVGGLSAGSEYRLSFAYWGDNIPTDLYGTFETYNLIYSIGANSHSVSGSWDTAQSGTFNTVNYYFTATASTETLSFAANTPSDSVASPIIGSVTIISVPEPSSLLLCGSGMLGLSLTFRRRR